MKIVWTASERRGSRDPGFHTAISAPGKVPATEGLSATLERVWRKPDAERKSRAGRQPEDAVLMHKTLVLSALCSLSDGQTGYHMRDPLSFLRFLGPGLAREGKNCCKRVASEIKDNAASS